MENTMRWFTNQEEGVEKIAEEIHSLLVQDKKVAWLIAGGSNIPIAVEILNLIKEKISTEESMPAGELQNLTVSQTDERYGDVGHADSNWQQMIEHGFDFAAVTWIPILRGESLEETVVAWGKEIEAVFAENDAVIAQFGIGVDGHIAGMIPHSPGVSVAGAAAGYVAEPFTRITLTFDLLKKISSAYVFAFGESKKEALERLQNDEPLEDEPAQVLKYIPKVSVYSDVIFPSF